MDNATKILCDDKGRLVAHIYDLNAFSETAFPTPEQCSLQFGFGLMNEDKNLEPHIHKTVDRTIDKTAEFIYVIDGEITIDVYCESENLIDRISLRNNMAILQFLGGHKISLKKGTRYFELKQGPYLGREHDKYILKGV